MNIQSISVVVPTKGCVNKCKACVSCMHESPYESNFDMIQIRKRLKFAANNGVNSLIITGTGEPLQNIKFLKDFIEVLDKEGHPFPNVELQTSGVMLLIDCSERTVKKLGVDKKYKNFLYLSYHNIDLLKRLGVNTISVSVWDIFYPGKNWDIVGAPENLRKLFIELFPFIKEQGFNLRLSLNMTKAYDDVYPSEILRKCKELGADQVTFRKLYHSNDDSDQTKWVKENACKNFTIENLNNYIVGESEMYAGDGFMIPTGKILPGAGKPLYRLPFGPMAYSVNGMSIVIDNDCMSKEETDKLKYVILRENGKLYCRWDDEGSLIF